MTPSRTAVVTGSTSGIGLAIARALGAGGYNLVFNGFGDPAAIDVLTADVAARFGVGAVHHPADLSRPAEVRELVRFAEQHFGDVNVLVNNAGIQHTSPIESFPDDRWDALLAVNLSAAFHAIKAVLPGMRARNFGRIVNIASAHGLVGSVHKSAYVAAKHGLVGLTKVAALETADADITVNAVCPGWVRTPLVEKQIDALAQSAGVSAAEAADRLLGEKQPKKRFVMPEDEAALVVFLCGEAAAAMTGEVLSLDGGWTAR
jgi:3-hydroxybutyrate dehydrogenase